MARRRPKSATRERQITDLLESVGDKVKFSSRVSRSLLIDFNDRSQRVGVPRALQKAVAVMLTTLTDPDLTDEQFADLLEEGDRMVKLHRQYPRKGAARDIASRIGK